MADPIILGKVTLYARIVELENGTKALAVAKYTAPGNKCRVPFNQTDEAEAVHFVQLGDSSAHFPPVEGKDPNGECDVEAPFLRYDLRDDVFWVVVNKAGVRDRYLQGSLSMILNAGSPK